VVTEKFDTVERLYRRPVRRPPVTVNSGHLWPEVGVLLYLGVEPRDRMRILRVTPWIYPDTKGGGDYHVHAMSRDQAAMGHDVTVLTTREDDSLSRV